MFMAALSLSRLMAVATWLSKWMCGCAPIIAGSGGDVKQCALKSVPTAAGRRLSEEKERMF
jgi:hypothetical protein